MKPRSLVFLLVVALLLVGLTVTGCQLPGQTSASKFPERPVTMIVGFNPGGGTDTAARGLQPYLQKALGVSVLVENKPGNSGLTAANEVLDAKADGYTILAGTNGTALIAQLYKDSWKSKSQFSDAFISIYSWVNADGNGIYVKKDAPWQTMDELAAEAKKRPIIFCIAAGLASTDQVTALSIRKAYGGQWTIIPFDSAAEGTAAVLGGKCDAASGSPASASMDPQTIRMLAVTMEKRSTRWPNTPTFQELGKPQCTIHFVIGAMVPVGTPPEVTKKLEEAFATARNDPEYIAWAQKTNQPIGDAGWDSKKFQTFLRDYTSNAQVIIPDMIEEMNKAQQGIK